MGRLVGMDSIVKKKKADILSFSFFMLHVKTDFVSACLFVMFSLSCLKKDARMKQTGV